MTSRPRILAAAALLALAAAGAPLPARADGPLPIRPPEHLRETGLYLRAGVLDVDPRNRPYSPQYPLWSDGAGKSRWIFLPEGGRIDASDPGAWRFPVGTKLWKEFAFGGRNVETRMLWQAGAGTWIFATYVWNAEQTDATLAPEAGLPDFAEIAPGKRHSIPGTADCRTCHEAGPTVVLGFSALQLSDDRDPLAPHAEPLAPGMVTLGALVREGLLESPSGDLSGAPPRIRAGSPRERAVLGYLASNCGTCHNTSGPLARLGLFLAHDPAGSKDAPEPALASAVDARGRYVVPGSPEGTSRLLAPGHPERSALLYRMRSRRPSSQMPPLGTVIPDEEAIRLVESWIAEELPPLPVPRGASGEPRIPGPSSSPPAAGRRAP